jgi:hypothetical protein
MPMTIDWNEAAFALRREVDKHGGFLTLQRDTLRERFGIGGFGKKNTEDLVDTLRSHAMLVSPHPYNMEGSSLRVYNVESEIGKIALAVLEPHSVSERALIDTVSLHERATAGQRRRSICVSWLSAFDLLLQLVIGRSPEGWEDLDDDREPFELVEALAESLELPVGIVHASDTVRLAGAVCACRPRGRRWDGAPSELGTTLADAAHKHKNIFESVIREAAKHLLGGDQIPPWEVDVGGLGLRYRREAQGEV